MNQNKLYVDFLGTPVEPGDLVLRAFKSKEFQICRLVSIEEVTGSWRKQTGASIRLKPTEKGKNACVVTCFKGNILTPIVKLSDGENKK